MAGNLKELVVKFLGDDTDLNTKFDDATSKAKKFGDSMSKAGGLLTAGVTLPILGIGLAAIKAASDSQQGMNQTMAVIKSTGGAAGITAQHVTDLASAQLKLTGIDDDAVQAGENMLLTFTNIGAKGGVFDQATKTALDMATALNNGVTPSAQQVQQQSLQLGKALNDPAKGYAALQRVGVTFTQQQIDQIKTMQAHGNIMGAQKVILGELSKEFGGSAVQSGKTFGGMLEGLKNQGGNLLEALGDKLLPVLSKGLTAITPVVIAVTDAITNMSPTILTIVAVAGGLLAALGPVLLILGQLFGAFATLMPVITAVGGIIGAIASGPVLLIIAGIAAVVAGIVLLITHWNQVMSAIQSNPVFQFIAQKILPVLVTAFQQLGSVLTSQIGPIFNQLQATLQQNLIPAWQNLQTMFDTIKPALVVVGAIIGGVLVIALGLLVGVLKGVFSALGPILSGVIQVFGGIVTIISGVVQTVVGIFQILVGLVKGIFTGDWTTLGDGLKNLGSGVLKILSGLWQAIVGIFQGLVGGVVGLVTGLVSGVIGFFQNLWETIVGHSIIPDLVNGILDWIGNLVSTFIGFIDGLVIKIVSNFINLGVLVLSAVNNFVQLVLHTADQWRDEFIARIQAMIALAQAVFHGIIDVITAPFKTAKDTVMGILDDIKSFFNGLHLQLPHINLPHFSISGNFSVNPPSVPHLDVQWYANGGIFTAPSIIGVGEGRGPEAVIPLDRLPQLLGQTGNGGSGEGQAVVLNIDGRALARAILPHMVNEIRTAAGIRSM